MKIKRLSRKFFEKPTLAVAKELLGKFLVRKVSRKVIAGMITETEAYCGRNDLASHASKGRTARTEVMFGPAGHTYIYLIYGMYHCFNLVTGAKDYPAAVLIRGIITDGRYLDGPGKVCRFFKIDKTLNKEDISRSRKVWIEDRGIKIVPEQIKESRRIGIDYAGPYKNKPWRFYTKSVVT